MRAYVSAKAGLNVRSEPSLKGKILKRLPKGRPVEVDNVKKGVWSKVLSSPVPAYCLGDYLTTTPIEPYIPPFSYTQVNLHASAGGWPPTNNNELRTVSDNHVSAVLICTYQPQKAAENIQMFRSAGVDKFIIRAIAPLFPRDGAAWGRMALNRLAPFAEALGSAPLIVQLHNEPNLTDEGLYAGWNTGREYSAWFLKARRVILDAYPRAKIGFSPMSPGSAIAGRRIDEPSFMNECGDAIEASDWLAVHCYYGNPDASDLVIPSNMWRAYARDKAIICTEAGPSAGKIATAKGLQKMFTDFSRARVPAFAWLLHSSGSAEFRGQSWAEMGIVLPRFGA